MSAILLVDHQHHQHHHPHHHTHHPQSLQSPTTTPKLELGRDGSTSSPSSTTSEPDHETFAQDHVGQQKRKGGRKPIYATSEERKQRNRQAQAAFRERRTEYIKQLEATIKHREETLQTLQQSHRAAADECLMLRYKNSLLERLLLEKGIDVQAELNAKAASPPPPMTTTTTTTTITTPTLVPSGGSHLGPAAAPPPPPTRKAGPTMKVEPHLPRHGPDRSLSNVQLTPRSRRPSPTSVVSAGRTTQGPMTPLASDRLSEQHEQQQQQEHRPRYPARPVHGRPSPPTLLEYTGPPVQLQIPASFPVSQSAVEVTCPVTASATTGVDTMGISTAGAIMMPASSYTAPFQDHFHQLEQEYDAQAGIVDDSIEGSAGPGPHLPLLEAAMMPPPSMALHPTLTTFEHPVTAPSATLPIFMHLGADAYGPATEGSLEPWHRLLYSNPYAFPPGTMR